MDVCRFIQWRTRMCNDSTCDKCDLGKAASEHFMSCGDFISAHTDEATKIVQRYRQKHEHEDETILYLEKRLKDFYDRIAQLEKNIERYKKKLR